MTTLESGRQFHVDRFTAQTFYQEPVNGVHSPWIPLEPLDYHPPRPEAHNVRRFFWCIACFANLVSPSKVLTNLPDDPGFISIDSTLGAPSYAYGEPPASQPVPMTQGYPTSQVSSLNISLPVNQPLSLARCYSFPATATPALQNPTRTSWNVRRAQRSA